MNIGANILMWLLRSLNGKKPDKSELESLKKKVNRLMKILQDLLLTGNSVTLCEVGASPYRPHFTLRIPCVVIGWSFADICDGVRPAGGVQ